MIKNRPKLKTWHLMPISLIVLLIAAIFVWFSRGNFSTKDVELKIEGPNQIENGKTETFFVVIKNNSSKALLSANLFIDIPSSFVFQNNSGSFESKIEKINPGEEKRMEFSIVASSDQSKETFSARLDYSPEGVSARFVSVGSYEIIIGKLDVSIIFDLPSTIYADQEIRGTIHIIPNSDIDTSPLYLKLNLPESFQIQDTNQVFDYETAWKLGSLKKGGVVKREFIGRPFRGRELYVFGVQLGKLEGISFLPLNSTEREVNISDSPLFLKQELQRPGRTNINQGEEVVIKISYINKSENAVEDLKITTKLPKDLIVVSSIQAQNARIDIGAGTIEWDKTTSNSLRFVEVDEEGEFLLSFRIKSDLLPGNVADTEKSLIIETNIKSEKESLSLGGAVLQSEDKLSLEFMTELNLEQSVFRESSDTGPHPPQAGEMSVYTIRWSLENTLNKARFVRVETVLPSYAVWQGHSVPANEDIKFISSTNTVVWDVGNVEVGTGNIFPARTAEFKIGLTPQQSDINAGLDVLLQTKLTGVDSFTDAFLEQDMGEVSPNNF